MFRKVKNVIELLGTHGSFRSVFLSRPRSFSSFNLVFVLLMSVKVSKHKDLKIKNTILNSRFLNHIIFAFLQIYKIYKNCLEIAKFWMIFEQKKVIHEHQFILGSISEFLNNTAFATSIWANNYCYLFFFCLKIYFKKHMTISVSRV